MKARYQFPSTDASSQINSSMIYGLAAHIYLNFNIHDFFSTIHFSYYDPNLLSEGSLMYRRRYRAFANFGYRATPFLKFLVSYTYSYDQYFTNNPQFYDSTEIRSLHPIHDMDFYLGFVFDIYHTDKIF